VNITEPGKNPEILIIGIGGTGSGIVDDLWTMRFPNCKTIAIDTEKQVFDRTHADLRILLGNGLIQGGRKGDPAMSACALRGVEPEIASLVTPGGVVLVTAGLGGGAGSGAAPQVARIAREKGALVIALITMPFHTLMGTIDTANEGLCQLLRHADTVIVMDNDRYLKRFCTHSIGQIHSKVNGIIADVITGIIKSLTIPCLINAEYEDFRVIFGNKGLAIVLDGESEFGVTNTNDSVVRNCLNSLSPDIDYRTASACFVLITAGSDLNRYDAEVIATSLTYEIDPHADVVWTANVEAPVEGRVRVYAIMAGIRQQMNTVGSM